MDKIHKGLLVNWQTHTLTYDRDVIEKAYPVMKDVDEFIIVTGTITDDPTGKRNDYDHTRTSLVINIDRENGKLETLNSIYDLGLEGNDIFNDIGNDVLKIFY